MAETKKKRKNGPAKGEGGRPRLQFNLDQIEGLGSIMATWEEMAAVLGCGVSTLTDRNRNDPDFSAALKRGQASGKLRLRRAQERAVERGNVTMMIWLGKQWLGQKDQVAVDATVEDRTGVAHVPEEQTLDYWRETYGSLEVDVGEPGEEPN